MLADHDATAAGVAEILSAQEPMTVSHIKVWEPGSFDWVGHDWETTGLLKSTGIGFEGPEVSKSGYSLERLDEVTAPMLLLEVLDDKAGDEMFDGPIWPTLPAVRSDQVTELDSSLWGGYGLLWANAVLADIERLFAS